MPLTAEIVRNALNYDAESGLFTWKVSRGTRKAGAQAGFMKEGYIYIRLHKVDHAAHRLAWLYMTGAWPVNDIDHINVIRTDNRFINLREATRSQNTMNTRRRRDNSSGLKGVHWHSRDHKFISRITINGKLTQLGSFDCPAAAHLRWQIEADKLHKQFARIS